MQPRRFCATALKSALLLANVFLPLPSFAQSNQTPTVDVAVGYERLHSAATARDFGPGVFVAIEGNYRDWLAVVGRFSATTSSQPPHFFGDPAAGGGAYLAGTRLHVPGAHSAAPFAQILIGIAQSGDDHAGYPAFAFQPGIGLDVAVHGHVNVRLAADYRWMSGIQAASGASASQRAFNMGLVVH